MIDNDINGASSYVKKTIANLLQNKVDLGLLVISKGLGRAEYAGKQAHSELANRMRERDAGSAPALGDRVSYVIIKGTKNQAAYEKAEDPIYVLEHNLPIDTKYYLENQLAKPLMRIFEPVLGEKANSLLCNESSLNYLAGDHTRTISVAAPTGKGGLMKFAVRTLLCLSCKTPVKHGRAACDNCLQSVPELFVKQTSQLIELEKKFASFWTQCQSCQGSLHQDILCTAQDCPIFYMRKKVQKDISDSHATLQRFEFEW